MAIFKRDIEYIRSLQRSTAAEVETVNSTAFLKQVLALYGVGKAADLIDAGLEAAGVNATKRQAGIELLEKIHESHSKIRGEKQIVIPSNELNELALIFDTNGISLNNNFYVSFNGNSSISEEAAYTMEAYCIEINHPGEEIGMNRLDLGFIRNEDISNIDYPAVSFTFMLDRYQEIYSSFKMILDKMRNRKTGRYGYRDDYSFENIEIFTVDQYNQVYTFTILLDCVISGIDGMNLSASNSGFQTIQMSVTFDSYKINEE